MNCGAGCYGYDCGLLPPGQRAPAAAPPLRPACHQVRKLERKTINYLYIYIYRERELEVEGCQWSLIKKNMSSQDFCCYHMTPAPMSVLWLSSRCLSSTLMPRGFVSYMGFISGTAASRIFVVGKVKTIVKRTWSACQPPGTQWRPHTRPSLFFSWRLVGSSAPSGPGRRLAGWLTAGWLAADSVGVGLFMLACQA